MLKIIKNADEMKAVYREIKTGNKKTGFIPTMGALHQGHLSLVTNCKSDNNISIASIFINPLQFNESDDFQKYPRTIEEDIEKLRNITCDYLFLPSEKDVYPDEKSRILDFNIGYLENVYEGQVRPGHFKGVALVVNRLFELIQPDFAYFGQKDYQQFLVLQKMVQENDLKIKIKMCPVIREDDGLAMSSRNRFLTDDQRKDAASLYQALNLLKVNYQKKPIDLIKKDAIKKIELNKDFKVEYLDVCDSTTLKPVDEWNDAEALVAIVAVRLPGLRLIDNILIN